MNHEDVIVPDAKDAARPALCDNCRDGTCDEHWIGDHKRALPDAVREVDCLRIRTVLAELRSAEAELASLKLRALAAERAVADARTAVREQQARLSELYGLKAGDAFNATTGAIERAAAKEI